MKKLVHLLRGNNRLYLITLFSVFIFLIGSMALTNLAPLLGQRLIILWISIIVYLMVFLGVDPILKGIVLTLVPIGILILLKDWTYALPDDLYEKWIEVDTVRGGPAAMVSFIILVMFIKVSKVKPYIKSLEEQERKKRA